MANDTDDQIVNDDESGFYESSKIVKNDEIIPCEPEVFTSEQEAKQDYPCFTPDESTAIFFVMFSSEYESFFCLSKFPFPYPDEEILKTNPRRIPYHNVAIEMENAGIGGILVNDSRYWEDTYEKDIAWLKENGLMPDKPFKVKVTVNYYQCGGYYDPLDLDVDIDCEIVR